jgi:predicted dehydrogenase
MSATIGVAVVGAGHWGPNLITNFHRDRRSDVRWVVDRDARRLSQVEEVFPELRTTEQLETALDDSSVDAVVIATSTSTHHRLTKAALQAGKHVLVEKPVAASVAEASELCSLAEQTGRILMVGHVFVYNAAVRRAKQYLTEGELGRIYFISMVRTNLGPIRVDVNAAWDLASHDVSLASYWLDAEPERVSAVGGSWINPGVEDAVFATLRYPGDVLVNLHASWLNPHKAREITIVGDQRMLTFDDVNLNEPLRIYDKQVMDERSPAPFVNDFSTFRMMVRDGDVLVPKVATSEPLRNECEHFLDCVENGSPPLSGGAEGLAVVRALEAISRSLAEGGREVKLSQVVA